MPLWLHALACVLVPGLWGVLMYFVVSALSRRKLTRDTENAPPPIDYSI